MAMMAVSSSMAFVQAPKLGKSDFTGRSVQTRQPAAASFASKSKSGFVVRAAGYSDELVKTAVSVPRSEFASRLGLSMLEALEW